MYLPLSCFFIQNDIFILLLEIIAVSLHRETKLSMKYSELHKLLRKYGCYETNKQKAGHPQWYSPITGNKFVTSNHQSQEVATGTLKNILTSAGIH